MRIRATNIKSCFFGKVANTYFSDNEKQIVDVNIKVNRTK